MDRSHVSTSKPVRADHGMAMPHKAAGTAEGRQPGVRRGTRTSPSPHASRRTPSPSVRKSPISPIQGGPSPQHGASAGGRPSPTGFQEAQPASRGRGAPSPATQEVRDIHRRSAAGVAAASRRRKIAHPSAPPSAAGDGHRRHPVRGSGAGAGKAASKPSSRRSGPSARKARTRSMGSALSASQATSAAAASDAGSTAAPSSPNPSGRINPEPQPVVAQPTLTASPPMAVAMDYDQLDQERQPTPRDKHFLSFRAQSSSAYDPRSGAHLLRLAPRIGAVGVRLGLEAVPRGQSGSASAAAAGGGGDGDAGIAPAPAGPVAAGAYAHATAGAAVSGPALSSPPGPCLRGRARRLAAVTAAVRPLGLRCAACIRTAPAAPTSMHRQAPRPPQPRPSTAPRSPAAAPPLRRSVCALVQPLALAVLPWLLTRHRQRRWPGLLAARRGTTQC